MLSYDRLGSILSRKSGFNCLHISTNEHVVGFIDVSPSSSLALEENWATVGTIIVAYISFSTVRSMNLQPMLLVSYLL